MLVSGATNTAITSNTTPEYCGLGITVTNGATGTSIQNNIVDDSQMPNAGASCPGGGIGDDVAVDASATASTVLDYNNAANCYTLVDGSSAIDSANSAAVQAPIAGTVAVTACRAISRSGRTPRSKWSPPPL